MVAHTPCAFFGLHLIAIRSHFHSLFIWDFGFFIALVSPSSWLPIVLAPQSVHMVDCHTDPDHILALKVTPIDVVLLVLTVPMPPTHIRRIPGLQLHRARSGRSRTPTRPSTHRRHSQPSVWSGRHGQDRD